MVQLSDAAFRVWAKSDRKQRERWLPLWCHLDDSGAMAERLWDEWLPASLRNILIQDIGSEDFARRLCVWLASVHDIGKATPAFAMQVPYLAEPMRRLGLGMEDRDERRHAVPHGLAGQIIVERWLVEQYGWKPKDARTIAVVVGGHHGVPPDTDEILHADELPELLGDDIDQHVWHQVRQEYLQRSVEMAGVDELLRALAGRRLSQQSQILLTGLVIVADWIASNEHWFPYRLGAGTESEAEHDTRADIGWEEVDLPYPWSAPVSYDETPEFFYRQRFSFPEDARPRPVQETVLELARDMRNPGIMIIEAPMGEGKTEAALTAAEVFAATTGAGGLFVALPTRATSDAMFTRVADWMRRIPDAKADFSHELRAISLAHGKAGMNDEFRSLMRRLTVQTSNDDLASGEAADAIRKADLAVHSWLRGRKKAMLAPFVIGTIDQLLFAALKAKHVVLRHLALAGKVVVIDEAHAYDAYMNVYLDRALAWLGAYRVPVIILSATLPAERRAALVDAYQSGWTRSFESQLDTADVPYQSREKTSPTTPLDADIGYPSIVVADGTNEPHVHTCEPSGRTIEIETTPLDDDLDTLVSTLRTELEDGGCALVLRNTVRRVQEAAEALLEEFEETEITVAHSRFLAPDRAALDRLLRDTFGPPSRLRETGKQRPARHILVASQVAEQSLDIDFDLLVTDLAPVDLLLQRMGRIHRHEGVRRPARLCTPRCFVTGANWRQDPPIPIRGSAIVYELHPLLRSLAILRPFLTENRRVSIPDDISPLVQRAYGSESIEPDGWRSLADDARQNWDKLLDKKYKKAETFLVSEPRGDRKAIVGWLQANVGDRDDTREGRAQVRDSRAESVEVIALVRRNDGALTLPTWLAEHGGEVLPEDVPPPWWLARAAAGCTLGLPTELCNQPTVDELEEREPLHGWQSDGLLADHLVLTFDEEGTTTLNGHHLKYDQKLGLKVYRGD